MPRDPHILAHQEWLGYVQPVGLVVSIPALLHVQAGVDRNIIPEHQKFLVAVAPAEKPSKIPPPKKRPDPAALFELPPSDRPLADNPITTLAFSPKGDLCLTGHGDGVKQTPIHLRIPLDIRSRIQPRRGGTT